MCSSDLTLHSDIIYAAGLVSRCDYYYQDGRTAVYPEHLERMRKYVANLTTIDIDQWDQAMRRAPRDGPGFIRYLASLCQGVPISEVKVVDEPNIGNVIEGMSKVMSGQRLTQGEMRAMRRGMQDTEIRSTAINLWGNALTAGSRKA